MTKKIKFFKNEKENLIKSAIENIKTQEEKRYNLPKDIQLSEVEQEALKGIALGRNKYELESAIKKFSMYDSYNS